ncbi:MULTISPECIES: helix-turn-helix domain-containing protein [Bradyrhizobium]|uniref:helix-turn-helix domain-containing protein n=1 Tax=Bradyrhizobium TaxID=374 RepID=UPI000576D9C0|nr:hypothetical protein [Bradyrhizobium sp. CCBAU 25360]MDA9456590.1 hypothetical protein [Bradyrhizobium sp. CCBAU 21359]MDA9515464.1 hypothetical protein [Bradyrhizobium sp. CCBAU 11430]
MRATGSGEGEDIESLTAARPAGPPPDNVQGFDLHLRARLLAAFGTAHTIGFAAAAKLLKLDQKTLRKHVRQGRIGSRIVGTGRWRIRREFALSDIEAFYAPMVERSLDTLGAPVRCGQKKRQGRIGFLLRHTARRASGRRKRA